MATYMIPGAMTKNNLGISSIITSDPASEVFVHEGVGAVAKVYMDEIELVSEAMDDQLFNEVVAIMRGRVTELVSTNFPGLANGDSCIISFNPGSVVEHTADGEFEVPEKEVSDLPSVNDSAPAYEMHYHFTREQLFTIAAKGGFVPGYADYAIPSNILHREWQSIPVLMDVTEVRLPSQTSIYFFELENAMCAEVDMRSIGYNLSEYFLVSEEMRINPERVVGLESEASIETPDYVSREEALEDALSELEEEMAPIEEEPLPEEEPESEAQAEDSDSVMLGSGYADPRETAYAESARSQQALDEIAIKAILEGRSAAEAVEEARAEVTANRSTTFDGMDDKPEVSVSSPTSTVGGSVPAAAKPATSDGELDLELDELDEVKSEIDDPMDASVSFDERGLSKEERKARQSVKAKNVEAVADMMIDGADSIADAQTNAQDNQPGKDDPDADLMHW